MPKTYLLLALLCVPMIVGCDGCRRDPTATQDGKKEEAPKQDFTAGVPEPFPADESVGRNAMKPGHWITASQTLQSNKVDARGELRTKAGSYGTSLGTGAQSRSSSAIPSQRPVVMPKGQRRRFDYRLLPPLPGSMEEKTCFLTSQFTSTSQSLFFDVGSQPLRMMRSQEYFLVILTSRPERFGKIKEGDWVRPYRNRDDLTTSLVDYRIVIPKSDNVLPISNTMLDWTSTAVVIWDDLSADALTPDQLTAMNDWIHFGGQLIVNGAVAAGELDKTALRNVLPVQPSGNVELNAKAATKLLQSWKVKTDRSTEKQIALVNNQLGRVSLAGDLVDGAELLDQSGDLVVDLRVGRGRVVQPKFDITSDWISSWQSYDSFFNSAILGRPRRSYIQPTKNDFVRQTYPGLGRQTSDASFNTMMRIHSRDASLQDATNEPAMAKVWGDAGRMKIDPVTGLCGWSDSSDVITMCSNILRSESGIEIPKSSLVVKSLSIYLLLLVPINYVVFRLAGRLEFAWLAVPVIAIGGAILVARAARLDIGFARSQTEIAVMELQPGYERAHLTRVIAIYNSLSSTYQAQFKTIDACGWPINLDVTGSDQNQDSRVGTMFRTSYEEGPSLSDVPIGSNQIRLLHAEQMIDAGGRIRLSDDGDLINETPYELQDTLIIRKDINGAVEIAVVGGCSAESSTKPRFQPKDNVSVPDGLPMQTEKLIRRLASPGTMPRGSSRLVARIDSEVDGLTIQPEVNQRASQTIALVHLQHAPLPNAEKDDNLLTDFRVVNDLGEQE